VRRFTGPVGNRAAGHRPDAAFREWDMKTLKNLMARLAKDDRGGEVLEYALVGGLIVVAAIAVIGAVGTKVLARWNGLNDGL
jgi:pilus assembly protein Flp/PilA